MVLPPALSTVLSSITKAATVCAIKCPTTTFYGWRFLILVLQSISLFACMYTGWLVRSSFVENGLIWDAWTVADGGKLMLKSLQLTLKVCLSLWMIVETFW